MSYFVIQVQTRKEEEFLAISAKKLPDTKIKLFLPRRKLRIRQKGRWIDTISPIFSGYVFLKTDTLPHELLILIKGIPGFIRFLNNNYDIIPLRNDDEEMINHFLNFGEIVGKSYVCFDTNKRVRVVSGPLKGLEGSIVKVDKRKRRIKVNLSFYKNSHPIDFSYEVVNEIKDGNQIQ